MLQRTLLIDDSVPLHRLVRSQIEGESLEFHSAYNGEVGLSLAEAIRPSLILLDVDMPDMDGLEVCRRLKANATTSAIPVIFLTADRQVQARIAGLGAAGHVTKPYKPEELSMRVRACLQAVRDVEVRAMVDGLTGLWNRKHFNEYVTAQTARAAVAGQTVACISVDIDGLRRINSQFGNPFGDNLIRLIGSVLLNGCQRDAAVFHFDAGKFAIVLPATGRTGAASLAEHLREEVGRKATTVSGKEAGATCSFGVADTVVAGKLTLIERAKLALRRAKLNGGGCVCVARTLRARRVSAA